MDLNKIVKLVQDTLPHTIGIKDDESFVNYSFDTDVIVEIDSNNERFIGKHGEIINFPDYSECTLELTIDFTEDGRSRIFVGYACENNEYYSLNDLKFKKVENISQINPEEIFILSESTTKKELIVAFSERFGWIDNF